MCVGVTVRKEADIPFKHKAGFAPFGRRCCTELGSRVPGRVASGAGLYSEPDIWAQRRHCYFGVLNNSRVLI